MAEAILHAQRRTVVGKQARKLRREGIVPANMTVRHEASQPLQVDAHELERFLKTHGTATMVTLQIAGERSARARATMIGEMQRQAVTGAIEHIEFHQINLNEPVHSSVPVVVVGDAPAVKRFDGVMLHPLTAVEVQALPRDLPEAITVDVSGLEELNTSLFVRDLKPPSGVTILTAEDEPVVTIQAPRIVVEAPAEAAPAAPAAPAEAAPSEGEPANPEG